jgi:eukaryotic-like serine/threonine-protein kinase
MTANNWQRVEELFHSALEMDAAERAAFLAAECASDVATRAEVECLLLAFEKDQSFLEEPVFNAGLKALSAETASLTGQVIGAYRVERLLGKGGMGEVYLAEDTRLGRLVALKFLTRRLSDDNWACRQLIKEAQAVAQLDHPNICAVHGLEEVDGHSFIVMQYLEGEILLDLITSGGVGAEMILPLAQQMASAVAAAHAHGIIHRDIKPQNMIVTPAGQLKVLDFGLAKVIQVKPGARIADRQSQASRAGLIAGTVAYMSPEQLRAERLDYRSDIFSLGVVIYEVVSGQHPFARGNDAETISAILTASPPQLHNGLNSRLASIIRKCLEKDKELRYQSVSELLLDLQTLKINGKIDSSRHGLKLRLVAALLALALFIGLLFAMRERATIPTLAVLPFTNAIQDSQIDYLIDGLTESLADELAQQPSLKVKHPTTVSSYKGKQIDPLKAGRDLQVEILLIGRAERQGDQFILKSELVRVADGQRLWVADYDLKKMDTLAIHETIAAAVSAKLGAVDQEAQERGKAALMYRRKDKSEAFQHYLNGRYLWNKRNQENLERAIEFFRKAIDLDPTYARAYAGLADSYVLLDTVLYGKGKVPTVDAMNMAKAAVKRALEIEPNLPEAHNTLGVIKLKYEWDWPGAEEDFKQTMRINPDYAPAHYWYSNLLVITGRHNEALREGEIAKTLDPFSTSARVNYCRVFYYQRRFDKAGDCLNEVLKETPKQPPAQYVLGFVYQQRGKTAEAIQLFRSLYQEDKRQGVASLGYIYGKAGRKKEAFQALAEANELYKKGLFPPQEIAIIYLGIGDYDNAFKWLEMAYKDRFPSLTYLITEPALDELRSDPRFIDLAHRLKLNP